MADRMFSLYSDVSVTPVEWLWYPYIALGKITVLQGDPGDGKSTMIMHLIAELTTGGAAPDGVAFSHPRRVIYQCSEDSAADTIKPRLVGSGADCTQVAFLDETIHGSLTLSDDRLRDMMIQFAPSLLVIDPIQAYLGNDSDMLVPGRVRKALRKLSMWASTYDCAIVLIGHLNKSEGQKSLYRGLGSIDIAATARSVLQIERDTKDPSIRRLYQVKNNIGPIGRELRFSITEENGFAWEKCEPSDVSSHQQQKNDQIICSQAELAAIIIKQCLQAGDMLSKEIIKKLQDAGISRRTVNTVKGTLGISSYRRMRQWYWSMKPGEGKQVSSDMMEP